MGQSWKSLGKVLGMQSQGLVLLGIAWRKELGNFKPKSEGKGGNTKGNIYRLILIHSFIHSSLPHKSFCHLSFSHFRCNHCLGILGEIGDWGICRFEMQIEMQMNAESRLIHRFDGADWRIMTGGEGERVQEGRAEFCLDIVVVCGMQAAGTHIVGNPEA